MSDSLFNLDGKVALVTGATSGIGQRQAIALAAAGAAVVALGRRKTKLEDTRNTIESAGGRTRILVADLMERKQLGAITREAVSLFGKLDILVNAAGINLRESVDAVTPESWDHTLNLNLSTPFFLARECVADMQQRGWGRIINIASLQSTRAFPNGMAYGASKGGISQLTRAMAEAWSASGINCNAIAPGFFPTELTATVFADQPAISRLAAQTTIGRNGELRDIDGITVFLASTAADYITGQIINIDGGFTAK